MAGRMILIEGLDLAGKSTLVKRLETALKRQGIPVRVSRNALCPDNPSAGLADQIRRHSGAGLLETGTLFLAAHLWDARNFVAPADDTIHLQDSCWLRTLAYHMYHRTPQIPDMLQKELPAFPKFDVTFYLTAGMQQRQERLIKRGREQPNANDAGDHLVSTNPDEFERHERVLQELACTLVSAQVLDTTRFSQDQILNAALQMILKETYHDQVPRDSQKYPTDPVERVI